MQHQRTLIVGTTSDYIDLLRQKSPARSLLFVTSPSIRHKATEDQPEGDEELLCELNAPEMVISNLRKHILLYGILLKGVACFDCESMALTSHIASAFDLPYPSIDAILACRDKSRTRALWHADGVETPQYAKVSSSSQAAEFFEKNGLTCVLKPVDSSGSERVFKCNTSQECEAAYQIIRSPQQSPDIIIETYVEGTEYSCDFIVDPMLDSKQRVYKNQVIPIRFTRKIHAPISVFGTIMAYEVVEFPSGNFSKEEFFSLLSKAAEALGITRGICMLDFIVTDSGISLLEMTPRPGGDCLPWLIQKAINIDVLKLTLDFAGDSALYFNRSAIFEPLVGLRIHADQSGTLKSIDTHKVRRDSRVKDVFIKHRPGHTILLPPHDYDSWNLGHIIFNPFKDISCKEQCIYLLSMLNIELTALPLKGDSVPTPESEADNV